MKLFLILTTTLLLFSCKTVNLFEGQETAQNFEYLTPDSEHILKPDDKISVSVWNHDDLSIGSSFSIYNTNESFGKWVLIKKDSTATIPYIGKRKIAGLTIKQAEKQVERILSKNIQDPIVEIKVLNREITILGEVKSPGNYLLEKERFTLVEAIGKAEGINFYGNVKRIKVIRNNNTLIVNLNKVNQLSQKNIYLQAGDIVYIPSKKGKQTDLKAPSIIPFASLITAFGIIYSVLKK
ncbi:polysaccharide biosynthesis/export family protein [Wenyingzhuangia aestuarii]|uniref:polysaccharide biosynthesis/export family protein n=1 Tax=Wenyingzhuangia aestuarii TaxID=1647582 RepID=UPI00143C540F|nr:polysaccharide biosynthesis/export family protein [Wenyingzhuangia aestuarii]NJB82458.1 polysaccharide export outer membrane protein [Wenyingzhuangia aestuarii]